MTDPTRVLRPDGWLVVYDSQFRGHAPRSSELTDWLVAHYYRGMPWASRSPHYDPVAHPLPGFACVQREAADQPRHRGSRGPPFSLAGDRMHGNGLDPARCKRS